MRNDSDLLKRIGLRIKELRQEKGISQEALAEASGVDRTFVGGIERGERNASILTLCDIAHALGRDFAGLIG
jgi:transcriptional regulator with XRE-family HTH domain